MSYAIRREAPFPGDSRVRPRQQSRGRFGGDYRSAAAFHFTVTDRGGHRDRDLLGRALRCLLPLLALWLWPGLPVAAQESSPPPEPYSPFSDGQALFPEAPLADTAAAEEVRLQDGETQPFRGTFLGEQVKRQGALLILPELGRGRDEAAVVRPLRLHLPTQGWATFSVELPQISPPITEEDYGRLIAACRRRVRLAFEHLLQRGYRRIVVVGHGFGALMAVSWASVDKEHVPEGIIALNLIPYHPPGGERPMIQHLQKIKVPVLDLYGGRSHPFVVEQSEARERAGVLSGNPAYRQLLLKHADHDFTPYVPVLQRVVRNWLKQIPYEKQRLYRKQPELPDPPASTRAPLEVRVPGAETARI